MFLKEDIQISEPSLNFRDLENYLEIVSQNLLNPNELNQNLQSFLSNDEKNISDNHHLSILSENNRLKHLLNLKSEIIWEKDQEIQNLSLELQENIIKIESLSTIVAVITKERNDLLFQMEMVKKGSETEKVLKSKHMVRDSFGSVQSLSTNGFEETNSYTKRFHEQILLEKNKIESLNFELKLQNADLKTQIDSNAQELLKLKNKVKSLQERISYKDEIITQLVQSKEKVVPVFKQQQKAHTSRNEGSLSEMSLSYDKKVDFEVLNPKRKINFLNDSFQKNTSRSENEEVVKPPKISIFNKIKNLLTNEKI